MRAVPENAARVNPCPTTRFGHLFRVTTFGESHGVATAAWSTAAARIPLTASDHPAVSRQRRPRPVALTHAAARARRSEDLSATFPDDERHGGVTTGTTMTLLIENTEQRSKDYSTSRDTYRPGHADFTYDVKYGCAIIGRRPGKSARETAARVAAGAIRTTDRARMRVRGALIQIGPPRIDRRALGLGKGPASFFTPDRGMVAKFESYPTGGCANPAPGRRRIDGRRRPKACRPASAPVFTEARRQLGGHADAQSTPVKASRSGRLATATIAAKRTVDEMRMGTTGGRDYSLTPPRGGPGGILAESRPDRRSSRLRREATSSIP